MNTTQKLSSTKSQQKTTQIKNPHYCAITQFRNARVVIPESNRTLTKESEWNFQWTSDHTVKKPWPAEKKWTSATKQDEPQIGINRGENPVRSSLCRQIKDEDRPFRIEQSARNDVVAYQASVPGAITEKTSASWEHFKSPKSPKTETPSRETQS